MNSVLTRVWFAVALTTLITTSAQAGSSGHTVRAGRSAPGRARFKLVAQYGSGESDWKSWTTTIEEDGSVMQSVVDEPARKLEVDKRKVNRLADLVRRVRFYELRHEYTTPVKDGPTLILKITEAGRKHEVVLIQPTRSGRSREVARFMTIWSEVLRLVPSPNADQKR